MFLKQALCHIFVSQNGSCVLTLHRNTQICVPLSDQAAVIYFSETVITSFSKYLP